MSTSFERALDGFARGVADATITISEIPAPTFEEGERARYVHERLQTIGGWDELKMDSIGNVVARRRGESGKARVMIGAHLDTVFPDPITPVVRERGRLTGRGVGDNSVAVAALLGLAAALQESPPDGIGDVLLVANVGEEGLGDLRGVRRLLRDYKDQFDAYLAIEGHSLNRIQTAFTASYRYDVRMTTDGGHSWGAYGRPNAIARLARLITALEEIMPEVGAEPKSTLNVGLVQGGRSVNTIAPEAAFQLDLRSADPSALDALWRRAQRAMRGALPDKPGPEFKRIGNRPGGRIEARSPLLRAVVGARRGLGLPPPEFHGGSTDANLPIAAGYPATCIGITTGGEAHTEREWIRTAPIRTGTNYVGRALIAAARLPRADVRRQANI